MGSNRHVCGDSFFASVPTAKELFSNGLRFIGMVKAATTAFPINYLANIEISGRDATFLVTDASTGTDHLFRILACAWLDRTRLFRFNSRFIGTFPFARALTLTSR